MIERGFDLNKNIFTLLAGYYFCFQHAGRTKTKIPSFFLKKFKIILCWGTVPPMEWAIGEMYARDG